MFIKTIFGSTVYLNSRQEAALVLAEKIHKELEQERQKEEMLLLQDCLYKMEIRHKAYPMAEAIRRQSWERKLTECAPKHHAWQYTEFSFSHQGIEYLYREGEIVTLPEEEFIL